MTRDGPQGTLDSLKKDPAIMKPDILFILQQGATFHFPYEMGIYLPVCHEDAET